MFKKILLIIALLFSFFWWLNVSYAAWDDEEVVNIYDDTDNWLVKWVHIVRDDTKIVNKTSISDYVQKVVVWTLGFLAIIALIYFIYAWIMIMTAWWDDEKVKSQKKLIIAVIIWILLIFFAYSIVKTLFKWLNEAWKQDGWWWTIYEQIR